jgi:hypothetical protein
VLTKIVVTGQKPATVTASAPAVPLPLIPPSTIPQLLTAFRVTAIGVVSEFLAGACGDSRESPSCKGSNTMDANKPPSDAKDPNGAKAPGKPGAAEGFEDPKTGEKWVKGADGRGGWLDSKGKVWQPTGQGGLAHGGGGGMGGSHWDVQNPNGTHTNVYPGGRTR